MSQKDGPPYRDLPPIPVPKTRNKPKYTVVLINEAGKSHQIELTALGLRLGVTALLGLIVLIASGSIWLGGAVSGNRGDTHDEALAEKVRSLQAELQTKELSLALQEKRLKEFQESPTLAAGISRSGQGTAPGRTGSAGKDESRENSPLTGLQENFRSQVGGLGKSPGGDDELEESETSSAQPGALPGPRAESRPPGPATLTERPQNIVNFNAQEVSALVDNPEKPKLSFRLIKDQHDIPFAGYLFVFVETTDDRGENRIYGYPNDARLGEEELPVDFRQGKTISFKQNIKVELPYEPGVALTRVSILLYGESGKIVFQRGFERSELKNVTHRAAAPKPAVSDTSRQRAGDRRRAL